MPPRTNRPRAKKLKTEHTADNDNKKPSRRPPSRRPPTRRAKEPTAKERDSSSSLSSTSEFNEKVEEKEFIPSDEDHHPAVDSPEPDSDHIDSEEDDQKIPKTKKRKSNAASTTHNPRSLVVKNLAPGPTKDQLVSPGLIAGFAMDFLKKLAIPECNDREWLVVNDKTYRKALENWNEFIDLLCPKIVECDWTIPKLPAKDLVYRLHRDVRFSSDKTPYKKNFSVGFSRTGRKGPWALYYLQIEPGGKSLIAGGIWCPEKNELATIRNSIIRNSKPLRDVINHKEFTDMFGKPSRKSPTERSNIFGHKDELKNGPKMNGVDKSHPDLDLLKLRSIAATKSFTDDEVLSSSFMDEIVKAVKVLCPLVQCINEMILPQSDDEEEG